MIILINIYVVIIEALRLVTEVANDQNKEIRCVCIDFIFFLSYCVSSE